LIDQPSAPTIDPSLTPRSLEVMQSGVDSGLHSGAQLYASVDGRVAANFALGEAAAGVAMSTESLVPWLSNSKPLGAVAIAQLRERGLLDFDDRVTGFIPEFARDGKSGKGGITLRHILTHTAGLSIFADFPEASWDEIIATICAAGVQDAWVVGKTAGYDPRTSWYILGEVVRRVDGRDYGHYVRQEIFEPLGMRDSWMSMTPAQFAEYGGRNTLLPNADGEQAPMAYYEKRAGEMAPAGSARGPISELGRFYEAMLAGFRGEDTTVLRADAIRLLTARQRIGKPDLAMQYVVDWGLGFQIDSKRYSPTHPYGFGRHASDSTFGHGGMQSSNAFADPDHGLAVAFFFNSRPGEAAHHRRSQHLAAAIYDDLGLAG
jgi:CubicO group peptidase (beta-lactamase class C family)